MNEIRDTLGSMLTYLMKLEKEFNKEIEKYPEGTLRNYCRNGRNNYFRAKEENGKIIRHGITRNHYQIHQLARKRYLEAIRKNIGENIRVLDGAINMLKPLNGDIIMSELPRAYRGLPENFFLTRPIDMSSPVVNDTALKSTKDGYHQIASGIFVPDTLREAAIQGTLSNSQREQIREIQREWANQNYPRNTKNLEQKKIITSQGLKVRSMAEGSIAESIYEHDIPFRHDQLVAIGNQTVSPDFSFLSIVRGEIYWEHCGLTNSQKYVDYQRYKRGLYESIGFVPWRNFIVTFNEENGFFDTREIESIITNKLMRWLYLD